MIPCSRGTTKVDLHALANLKLSTPTAIYSFCPKEEEKFPSRCHNSLTANIDLHFGPGPLLALLTGSNLVKLTS